MRSNMYLKGTGLLLLLVFCRCSHLLGQKKFSGMKAQSDTVAAASVSAAMAEVQNDTPFLTGYYYASKKLFFGEFKAKVAGMARLKSLEYQGEDGFLPRTFSLPVFPSNIHVAFFFRNDPPAPSHNGDILEYKLVAGFDKNGDTSIPWTKTGTVVVFPVLEASTEYMLMVRYVGEGNKISVYFFKTDPAWLPYWKFLRKKLPYFLVLFLAVDIFLLWRFLRTKRRNRQYQLELKSLFAQLNPHFLFNSLGSIQGLINSNEIEKANQYLSGFSGLLRTTLDKGGKEVIPLSEEMENLENYIHFEQLRFNFTYEKDVEPGLPLEEINILPLLAQPLIENSVKHGISGMGGKGMLRIRIYAVERDLLVAVNDNGTGFDVEDYKAGYGVDLVRKRIDAYNKWHRRTKILLTMRSVPGNTVVVLQFQNWLPK